MIDQGLSVYAKKKPRTEEEQLNQPKKQKKYISNKELKSTLKAQSKLKKQTSRQSRTKPQDKKSFCITCTGNNQPTADCKCPVYASGTNTKTKCVEDKTPSTADCTTITKETPKEDCLSPDKTDKDTCEADSRIKLKKTFVHLGQFV
ncbi:MAG: hypothetical protein EZS28_041280 [Streblomastix strix]|uniref:Uncharacterized protein n=1 Tax=Streblomastix strix TaxID=222440 RepID=A0A5J4TXZ9_9EUKA|nr:MAG: hypothetical protein EZS28_041280 [Streblomastix strix]